MTAPRRHLLDETPPGPPERPGVEYEAAGGVVVHGERVLLVRRGADEYRLPKGHVDPGENAVSAGAREVFEEAGVSAVVVAELGLVENRFVMPDGNTFRLPGGTPVSRRVTWFLMVVDDERVGEHEPEWTPLWVSLAEAPGRLRFEAERVPIAWASDWLAAGARLRHVAAGDLAAVRALFEEEDRVHAGALPDLCRVPTEPRFGAADLAEELAGGDTRMLLAEQDGRVVGMVAASIRYPRLACEAERTWCSVDDLVVLPGARRRGVASRLMAAAELWARQRGAADVRLSVYEFNRPARALYASLGFETLSRVLRKPL